MPVKYLPIYLILVSSVPLKASEERHHGSHEHGVGKLNIAQDQAQIFIELESPAANIFGFEHRPKSEQEHEIVTSALHSLKNGATLFHLPKSAGCTLSDVNIEAPFEPEQGDASEHADEHHAHHHEDHYKKSEKVEHHGHEAVDEESRHADVHATWHYTCKNISKLTEIEIGLFKAFPATERLQAQFITETQQGAITLNRENSVLQLSQ